jgi:hypothetical protein
MPQASSHPPKTMSHLPSSPEDLEMAERRLIFHSTGGNRENGERKPALFSLFSSCSSSQKKQTNTLRMPG